MLAPSLLQVATEKKKFTDATLTMGELINILYVRNNQFQTYQFLSIFFSHSSIGTSHTISSSIFVFPKAYKVEKVESQDLPLNMYFFPFLYYFMHVSGNPMFKLQLCSFRN